MKIQLRKSTRPEKKYMVVLDNRITVHFGAAGMSDFTKHRDPARKDSYIQRHRARENWQKSGITTAGFWSRWLLWNKPTIQESKKDITKRFDVTFV
jgi:hypothetical protein